MHSPECHFTMHCCFTLQAISVTGFTVCLKDIQALDAVHAPVTIQFIALGSKSNLSVIHLGGDSVANRGQGMGRRDRGRETEGGRQREGDRGRETEGVEGDCRETRA